MVRARRSVRRRCPETRKMDHGHHGVCAGHHPDHPRAMRLAQANNGLTISVTTRLLQLGMGTCSSSDEGQDNEGRRRPGDRHEGALSPVAASHERHRTHDVQSPSNTATYGLNSAAAIALDEHRSHTRFLPQHQGDKGARFAAEEGRTGPRSRPRRGPTRTSPTQATTRYRIPPARSGRPTTRPRRRRAQPRQRRQTLRRGRQYSTEYGQQGAPRRPSGSPTARIRRRLEQHHAGDAAPERRPSSTRQRARG